MNCMCDKKTIGKSGEDLACEYLLKNNYNIICRNFSCYQGEIDIIAFDKSSKELVFFEVKTRLNFNYGMPAEAINSVKLRHMRHSIEYYLYKMRLEDAFVRVDAIEIVVWKGQYKLNHLNGIF